MNIDLSNRTALVTGGSRGIGSAVAQTLAQAGAKVMVGYWVERPSADLVVNKIKEQGGEADALAADISNASEAEMLVNETVDRFGSLDILVNNAGIWKRSPIDETTDKEWREMLGINLDGPFYVTRAAIPHLIASKGSIVNITSTAAQRGEAFHSHYAAAKGAINSWTKSLAVELSPIVRVNAVAPGWVETRMTEETLKSPQGAEIAKSIPLGRVGQPNEVATAVLFLASDLSSYVQGEILNVNGGSVLCG